MKTQKFDYLIIGAGFAGLATAFYLLKEQKGSVCIIEKEKAPGLAASGRNASMICQIVRDTTLCHLMLESTRFIKKEWLSLFPNVGFKECGSLHLGRREDIDALAGSIEIAQKDFDVQTERWTVRETKKKYPFLEETLFEEALYCSSDGIIDIHTLIRSLTEFCQEKGVAFIPDETCLPSRNLDGSFEYDLKDGTEIRAEKIINAAGAWAGVVANAIGAQSFPVLPLRRHIYVTDPHPLEKSVKDWPIVWDIPNGVYFRPADEALMLCPCDEELHEPAHSFVDPCVEQILREKLKFFLPAAMELPLTTQWSGLRTFSDDRRFAVGWDSKIENFFWVACLGGYGMTSSAAVGKLAASMLTGKKISEELRVHLNPKRLKPTFVKVNR